MGNTPTRICDVPVGAVVSPDRGPAFKVEFNGYQDDGHFASGWRTLRGPALDGSGEVAHTDIWEFHVEVMPA